MPGHLYADTGANQTQRLHRRRQRHPVFQLRHRRRPVERGARPFGHEPAARCSGAHLRAQWPFLSRRSGQSPNTADDTRVRLYGINLSFATNFPSDADALRLAQRLRKLGINAVRLHHMDSSPGTQDNPPRSLLTPAPYPSFNQVAVSRLRNFINALKQQGIYVDLNLHVGYRFRPAVDQLPPLDGKAEATP